MAKASERELAIRERARWTPDEAHAVALYWTEQEKVAQRKMREREAAREQLAAGEAG